MSDHAVYLVCKTLAFAGLGATLWMWGFHCGFLSKPRYVKEREADLIPINHGRELWIAAPNDEAAAEILSSIPRPEAP